MRAHRARRAPQLHCLHRTKASIRLPTPTTRGHAYFPNVPTTVDTSIHWVSWYQEPPPNPWANSSDDCVPPTSQHPTSQHPSHAWPCPPMPLPIVPALVLPHLLGHWAPGALPPAHHPPAGASPHRCGTTGSAPGMTAYSTTCLVNHHSIPVPPPPPLAGWAP